MRFDADGFLSTPASQREPRLTGITLCDGGKAMASRSTRTSHAKSSATRSSSSAKKTYPTKSGRRSTTPPSRRWSAKVKTDSTKPGPGLFKKSAEKIAKELAKKSVSPQGPGQGMRMLSFYENRAGKNLSAERKRTLEHAKEILHEKEGKSSAKSGSHSRSRSTSASKHKSRSSGRSGARSHTRRSGKKAN
jgi:tRNA(adenine34) deaminase